ncbi:hypothetical protein [Comamonas sp. JC664]|uniref:hypothetical protein n=1 Tax=Comamonas sp. JC664 TaxID=2801917 RepID=UPI0017480514|nr:hypothetical protein [Comamonas sp. JC664]MBL0697341.1 hypothetical protein [Comamonas sp. JC664]GHG67158.1 hypothetical protein GCM10012319_09290 [Comamonas sp. KCTC 72670]
MDARTQPPAPRSGAPVTLWLLTVLEALGVAVFVLSCVAMLGVAGFKLLSLRGGERASAALPLPPVYGRLPAFTLPDGRGALLEGAHLQGHITLLQFSRVAASRPAMEFASVLQVQQALVRAGVAADVILVAVAPEPTPPVEPLPGGWRQVWDGAALERSARVLGRAHLADDAERLLVLVDPVGAVRGIYASSADAPDTAWKVEEDARCLRTCGPFR